MISILFFFLELYEFLRKDYTYIFWGEVVY